MMYRLSEFICEICGKKTGSLPQIAQIFTETKPTV